MINVPELVQLRNEARKLRSAPTTPIDVPVQESKTNGAVEQAVKSWEGQFPTIRAHVESELSAFDERRISAPPPVAIVRMVGIIGVEQVCSAPEW